MSVIELWRCPECGWTRSGKYGGKCRNAFAHESIDAPKTEKVEYVTAADYRGAVDALRDAWSYLDHDEPDAAQVVIARACEELGIDPAINPRGQ